MDAGVAILARPSNTAPPRRVVGWNIGSKRVGLGVRGSRMPGPIMAFLADIGDLLHQQLIMVTAVGCMAGQTVLLHRRVLVHVRAPFFSVTGIAQLIDRVGFQILGTERTMGSVAVGAGNLPLFDGMMRLTVRLCPDIPMARETKLGLGHLQILGKIGVTGMATTAGKTRRPMLAGLPKSDMITAAMAREALGAQLLRGTSSILAERDDCLFGLSAAKMLIGRPVAGLAAMGALPCLAMEGAGKTGRCLFMAFGAGVIATGSGYGWSPPGQHKHGPCRPQAQCGPSCVRP